MGHDVNRYLYEFQCPCGTNSYIALAAENEVPMPYLFEKVCWLAEKHVREEGNTFDPTKLKLIEVRNFE